MQRYTALWLFPVMSLALVVFMALRSGRVIDAPVEKRASLATELEEPTSLATQLAELAERNANLSVILAKSVDARTTLQQHVQALQSEVQEMRAARTALVDEAKLWRDSYDVLAERFDALAKLARVDGPADGPADGAMARPASFGIEAVPVPRPSDVVIVR